MTAPIYDSKITLGNILAFAGTIIINLVLVVTFLTTDHATLQMHGREIATIQAERRENLNEIRGSIATTTKRMQVLEDWRDIAPRFTPTDAALLKSQTVAEANTFAASQIERLNEEINKLSAAVQSLNVLMREHIAESRPGH